MALLSNQIPPGDATMNDEKRLIGFAPDDLTNGRKCLDWKTRYSDREAQRAILLEAAYVVVLLFGTPVLILLIWLEIPRPWLSIDQTQYKVFAGYAYAWLGGTFGGTLFDTKWLYHSVAKQLWHLDRRLWRFFTPHISGALGFAVVLLISSGILRIFNQTDISLPAVSLTIGFMVGYFSDSATAKLTEVAETLFGATHKQR